MSDGTIKFEAIATSEARAGQMGFAIKAPDTEQLSDEALNQALGIVREVASRIEDSLTGAGGPQEIDLQLGLSVQAGGSVWIANTQVTATIQVTFSWKR